ncbi:hypothetical protein QL285_014731 [Trifolium repens]|nr:hypothetical protein QL285_014731 [Trifolium repens]
MKDWRDLKDINVTLEAPTDEDTTRRVPLLGDIAYQLHPLVGIIQQCHNNVADISFNWKMLLASHKRPTKDKGLHHPKIVGLLPRIPSPRNSRQVGGTSATAEHARRDKQKEVPQSPPRRRGNQHSPPRPSRSPHRR